MGTGPLGSNLDSVMLWVRCIRIQKRFGIEVGFVVVSKQPQAISRAWVRGNSLFFPQPNSTPDWNSPTTNPLLEDRVEVAVCFQSGVLGFWEELAISSYARTDKRRLMQTASYLCEMPFPHHVLSFCAVTVHKTRPERCNPVPHSLTSEYLSPCWVFICCRSSAWN